jgi:hypothetical protein
MRIGAWNYIVLKSSIYKNPGFDILKKDEHNEDNETRFRTERLDYMADAHQQVYDFDDDPTHVKVGRWFLNIWYEFINFYGRVLPQYLDRKQENIDTREKREHPYITHKLKKVKPGGDYFAETFIVLIIILVLTLIYWKNIAGETKK